MNKTAKLLLVGAALMLMGAGFDSAPVQLVGGVVFTAGLVLLVMRFLS